MMTMSLASNMAGHIWCFFKKTPRILCWYPNDRAPYRVIEE